MIVVTGANGFVGRYLVDRLAHEEFEVLAVVHSSRSAQYYMQEHIPYIVADIQSLTNCMKLPKANVNAVVHLAGLLSIDAEGWSAKDYMLVNTLGTRNVMEYCKAAKVPKIIFSQTHSDVNRAREVVITEQTPQQFGGTLNEGSPLPYIISKIAAQNFVDAYAKELSMQGISFRLPGIRGFGSRDTHYNCVFHQFIQKAIAGEPIEIWGDHKTKRDFVYVKDVVNAIVLALASTRANGLYNIGSGIGLTIEDEARAIIKVFSPEDRPSKLVYRTDIEEVRKRSYIFDVSKAMHDFGYCPDFSYVEGLRDFKREMQMNRFALLGDRL
jgi:UDP-glucose 4-epimerase